MSLVRDSFLEYCHIIAEATLLGGDERGPSGPWSAALSSAACACCFGLRCPRRPQGRRARSAAKRAKGDGGRAAQESLTFGHVRASEQPECPQIEGRLVRIAQPVGELRGRLCVVLLVLIGDYVEVWSSHEPPLHASAWRGACMAERALQLAQRMHAPSCLTRPRGDSFVTLVVSVPSSALCSRRSSTLQQCGKVWNITNGWVLGPKTPWWHGSCHDHPAYQLSTWSCSTRRSPAHGGGPSRPLFTSGRILQKRASSSSSAPPGLDSRYGCHTHMPKVSSCHHGRCSNPAWAFSQLSMPKKQVGTCQSGSGSRVEMPSPYVMRAVASCECHVSRVMPLNSEYLQVRRRHSTHGCMHPSTI
eukprot:364904-Chlamydomonas_euryale.AAC.3